MLLGSRGSVLDILATVAVQLGAVQTKRIPQVCKSEGVFSDSCVFELKRFII